MGLVSDMLNMLPSFTADAGELNVAVGATFVTACDPVLLPEPLSLSVTVIVTVYGLPPLLLSAYTCDGAVHVPEPLVSLTTPAVTAVPSPKFTVQVWVSNVPASVKLADMLAVPPSVIPDVLTVPTTGFAFVTVTVVV